MKKELQMMEIGVYGDLGSVLFYSFTEDRFYFAKYYYKNRYETEYSQIDICSALHTYACMTTGQSASTINHSNIKKLIQKYPRFEFLMKVYREFAFKSQYKISDFNASQSSITVFDLGEVLGLKHEEAWAKIGSFINKRDESDAEKVIAMLYQKIEFYEEAFLQYERELKKNDNYVSLVHGEMYNGYKFLGIKREKDCFNELYFRLLFTKDGKNEDSGAKPYEVIQEEGEVRLTETWACSCSDFLKKLGIGIIKN